MAMYRLYFLLLLSSAIYGRAEWKPVEHQMITSWGKKVNPGNVWQEYPRPSFQRKAWTNLNGLWNYSITDRDALVQGSTLGQILVPFCPESTLSGVGRLVEPGEAFWYERSFSVQSHKKTRTLLHFGAVDYECTVWINGKEVGRHKGGHTPFSFEISDSIAAGVNKLVVRVWDATEGWQLRGKQALQPKGITATRVSGIWQTVWLEQVPWTYLDSFQAESRETDGPPNVWELLVKPSVGGVRTKGEKVKVTISFGGKEVATVTGSGNMAMEVPSPKLWSPAAPNLYDLKFELLDESGNTVDEVQSYTALRSIGKKRDLGGHMRFFLNNQETFFLGPLDQGWWPDGLLTPPSDDAILADLNYIKSAGFNMVRKHVKVEPERYYYHCDRLGLAVWQDQVSAGMWEGDLPAGSSPKWIRMNSKAQDAVWPAEAHEQWVAEYKAMVDHLRNHPCVIIWTPFNEAWGQHDSMGIGKMAVDYDPTRLVCLASGGNFWPVGDIASAHHYPAPTFPFADRRFRDYVKVVGEMGGYGWSVPGHLWSGEARTWSYNAASSQEDLKARYKSTIEQLGSLRELGISAAVYTQTSDFETEVNGLLTYDRIPKLDSSWLKPINEGVISIHQRFPSARTPHPVAPASK